MTKCVVTRETIEKGLAPTLVTQSPAETGDAGDEPAEAESA